MKKTVVVLIITAISIFSFSQTALYPVAHKLNGTRYERTSLSLDTYLSGNKDKCTKRVAEQMIKLEKEKNPEFLKYSKAIGLKLRQVDDRCNFFRFELIDYIEDSALDYRFAYRCYATKGETLPSQRVSHIDPLVINPSVFYRDEDLIEEECDALTIMKQLSAKPAKSQSGTNSTTTPHVTPKSSGSSARPANNSKKGSGQN
jgi:hypothetical protein